MAYESRFPQTTSRSQEGFKRLEEYEEEAENLITSHPESSVLITFGLGFGLGLLLASLFESRPKHWYERYVPGPVHRMMPESWKS